MLKVVSGVEAYAYAHARICFAKLIFLCALLSLTACGPGSGLSDDQKSKDELMISKPTSIPDVPRRMLIKETEWGNKKTMSIGVNTSFAGSEFAVETDIAVTMRFGITVWMFSPGEGDALRENEVGEVFLKNSPDHPFTFICRYQGYMDFDPRMREKLSLFGSGLANENFNKETTGVLQTSRTFSVEEGDSWPRVFKRCQEYAAQTSMMASVERDLRNMTKGLVYHDDQSSCMVDSHCSNWHNTLISGVKDWTVPVCQKEADSNKRYCSIAGSVGSACPLYDAKSGQRLTQGYFEYRCRSGLTCTTTQEGGWFSYYKAECK